MPAAPPTLKLRAFDVSALPDPSQWAAGLADAADWAAELGEPFGDVPEFNPETDGEVSVTAGLKSDRAMIGTPARRLFVDYRANPDAFKHLDHMPKAGQTLHGVISGRYALFEMIAALIERTGEGIADLTICTLGFSKTNAADLLGLLDDGQVKRVTLLVILLQIHQPPDL